MQIERSWSHATKTGKYIDHLIAQPIFLGSTIRRFAQRPWLLFNGCFSDAEIGIQRLPSYELNMTTIPGCQELIFETAVCPFSWFTLRHTSWTRPHLTRVRRCSGLHCAYGSCMERCTLTMDDPMYAHVFRTFTHSKIPMLPVPLLLRALTELP